MFKLTSNQKSLRGYGFRVNPFPYVGVPGEVLETYSGRERELEVISEAVGGVIGGSSSHLVLVGSYGNGKTATLKLIKSSLETQLKDEIIAPYVSNPGETFLDFYRNLMQDIGEKKLRKLVWRVQEMKSGTNELESKVVKGEVLLAEVLQKIRIQLYDEFGHADFVNAMIQLTLDERRFDAWRYISGEPTLSENRRILDVVSAIDNNKRALWAMMDMLRFSHWLG